jgi:hypothetical protein
MYKRGSSFTIASILLSLTPFTGSQGALWLIGFRVVRGVGGALLLANSTAIPPMRSQRGGSGVGINMVAAIAGQFFGLVIGGLLADVDWRLIFWVTCRRPVRDDWAYLKLREVGAAPGSAWTGGATSRSPWADPRARGHHLRHPALRQRHSMGWSNPDRAPRLAVGGAARGVRDRASGRGADVQPALFRSASSLAGNVANFMISIGKRRPAVC